MHREIIQLWKWLISAPSDPFPTLNELSELSQTENLLTELTLERRKLLNSLCLRGREPEAEVQQLQFDRLEIYDCCVEFLKNCKPENQFGGVDFACLSFIADKNLPFFAVESVSVLFFHCLTKNSEKTQALYDRYKDYFNANPFIKNGLSLRTELARVDKLLSSEKNLLGLLPLFVNTFGEIETFTAILITLLKRGVDSKAIIDSSLLHQFLAYNFVNLDTEDSEIKALYKNLTLFPEAAQLIANAKETIVTIPNYRVAYSLTAEQREGNPSEIEPLNFKLVFGYERENFQKLYALFGEMFISCALVHYREVKDEKLKNLLCTYFEALPPQQLAERLNQTGRYASSILPSLAELISEAKLNELINNNQGALFYLLPSKPQLLKLLNEPETLKSYLANLDNRMEDSFLVLSQLMQLYRLIDKSLRPLLYVPIFNLSLSQTSLADPALIRLLAKDALTHSTLIKQQLENIATSLKAAVQQYFLAKESWTQEDYYFVEDCWVENQRKWNFLKRIMKNISSMQDFPTDKYAFYAYLIKVLIEEKSPANFELESFLHEVLTIKRNDSEVIAEYERALIEVFVKNAPLRSICSSLMAASTCKEPIVKLICIRSAIIGKYNILSLLLNAKEVNAELLNFALSEVSSVAKWSGGRFFYATKDDCTQALRKATDAIELEAVKFLCSLDNMLTDEAFSKALFWANRACQWELVMLLCTLSKDKKLSRDILSKVLKEAACLGQWTVVRELCNAERASKPSYLAFSKALVLATNASQWGIVLKICSMEDDQKPGKKEVSEALELAARHAPLEVIQRFCAMSGENKPSSEALVNAMKKAIYYSRLDVMQELCAIVTENDPQGKSLTKVLEFAIHLDRVEAIRILTDIPSEQNKLSPECLANALKIAARSNRGASVEALVQRSGDKQPTSELISEVLEIAVRARQWEIMKILAKSTSSENRANPEVTFEALRIATNAGQWETVKILCADGNLTAEAVSYVFELAIYQGPLELLKQFCTMSGDNKPTPELVAKLLRCSAAYSEKREVVELVCQMEGDNRPTRATISEALQIAAGQRQWKLVEIFTDLDTDHKPTSEAIAKVLQEAASLGHIDIVQRLSRMTTDNRPSSEAISIALRKAPAELRTCLKTAHALALTREKIAKLKNYGKVLKEKYPRSDDGQRTQNIAVDLQTLVEQFTNLVLGAEPVDKEELCRVQEEFKTTFNKAYLTMGNHRAQWKPILLNIAIAASGIGLLLICGKLFFDGNLFFAQTERQNILENIGKEIAVVAKVGS